MLHSISCIKAGRPVVAISLIKALFHMKSSFFFVTKGAFLFTDMEIRSRDSTNLAMTVAKAPPKTPSLGNGPRPKIRSAFRIAFRNKERIVVNIGVFESPSALNAPLYIIEKPEKI